MNLPNPKHGLLLLAIIVAFLGFSVAGFVHSDEPDTSTVQITQGEPVPTLSVQDIDETNSEPTTDSQNSLDSADAPAQEQPSPVSVPEATPQDEPAALPTIHDLANTSLPFIQNQGQVDSTDVSFYTNTFAGKAYVLPQGLRYVFLSDKVPSSPESSDPSIPFGIPYKDSTGAIQQNLPISTPHTSAVVDESFVGSQGTLTPTATEPMDVDLSSFIGNDKSEWKTNLSAFRTVHAGEVWPGVDVAYHAHGENIEKIFTVAPHANPEPIKMLVNGGTLSVDDQGRLVIHNEAGDILLTKPVAFQNIDGTKVDVSVSYSLISPDTYTFSLGLYNEDYPLTIDPLIAGTYLGGSNSDQGYVVVKGPTGDFYVSGYTFDNTFPVTTGVYNTNYTGGVTDQFIARFSYDFTTLKASTFIGGTGIDGTNPRISFETDGTILIAANTLSTDFPTTAGAYSTTSGGSSDVIIFKMNPTLTSLLVSTYFGSSSSDSPFTILPASDSSIYLYGTSSGTLPVTGGAYDTTQNGGEDLFIARFTNNLSSLVAATYLGGSGADHNASSKALAFDTSGNVVVIAGSSSSNFPTTVGAYDSSFNGSYDIVLSRVSADLATLVNSTYLGGSGDDDATPLEELAIGSDGSIYISSISNSSDFPVTNGSTFGGAHDTVVAKFSSDLSTLTASTYLGGNNYDRAYSVYLSSDDNFYVIGSTVSTNFPVTSGAYQSTFGGGTSDAFVTKFSSSLAVLASSYFGLLGGETGYDITQDSAGNLVLLMSANTNSDFVLPTGGYDLIRNGSDALLMKFSNLLALNVSPAATFISAVQTPGVKVTAVTTVTDSDNGKTSLTVEYSTNNVTWLPATIASATATGGGNVAVSGNVISSVDTDLGVSISVAFLWDIGVDLPTINNELVYVRVTPNDGNSNGDVVSYSSIRVTTASATSSAVFVAPSLPQVSTQPTSSNLAQPTSSNIVNVSPSAQNDSNATVTVLARYGQRLDMIKDLQIFLNNHGYIVAKTGHGSPGRETNYFGPRTLLALRGYKASNLQGYIPAKDRNVLDSYVWDLINRK